MPLSEQGVVRANLSYKEIERYTEWESTVMINDYLGIGQTTEIIAAAVDQNEEDIEENRLNIAANAANIQINADNLTDHEAETVVHGSAGDVVGNLDFCTDLAGGVVLLMDLVADAVDSTAEVTISDIGAAPATYSQTYTDEQTDLINDIKAKHNTMLADLNLAIAQLNELVANSKTAKQMALV